MYLVHKRYKHLEENRRLYRHGASVNRRIITAFFCTNVNDNI